MRLHPVDLLFIIVLLLFAAGLRFVGLSFGQPDPQYAASTYPRSLLQLEAAIHPDEFQFISLPLRMLVTGRFRINYLINPTLLTNLNLLTFWLTGANKGIDHEARVNLPASDRQYAPFPLYVIGRVYSVLGGVIGVAAMYATARRMAGRYAAMAAGLLAGVSFTLVQHAHYTTQTSLSGGLVALSIWASLVSLQSTRHRRLFYILACALAGLALSSRYNAGAVFIVPFLCGLLWLYQDYRGDRWLVFTGWFAFPILFLLGTPYALTEWRTFIQDVQYGFGHYLGEVDNLTPIENGLFYMYRHLAIFSTGIVSVGMALIGIWAAWKGRPPYRQWLKTNNLFLSVALLLIYFTAYSVVVLRARRLGSDQLLVPAIPVIILLAAVGFGWCCTRVPPAVRRIAIPLSLLILIVVPLSLSLQLVRQFAQPDTRQVMQGWFAAHIPLGSRVHLNGPYNLPLDQVDYAWTQTYASELVTDTELAESGADFMVVSDAWYYSQFVSAEVLSPDLATGH